MAILIDGYKGKHIVKIIMNERGTDQIINLMSRIQFKEPNKGLKSETYYQSQLAMIQLSSLRATLSS